MPVEQTRPYDLAPSLSTIETLTGARADSAGQGRPPGLALTLLLHPSGRLGEVATLPALAPGVPVEVSRATPLFWGAERARALEHPRVSRRPLWLCRQGEELVISAGSTSLRVWVDGAPLQGSLRVPLSRLEQEGVVLELAGCVLLWVHQRDGSEPGWTGHGLLGVSREVHALREEITRAAATPAHVLLRGESGVGKELVATALHRASARAGRPWLAVNMAAIPRHMASAELFGHGRGAFTGATATRQGWFEQAHGGTLFLDEIGETPDEVQPQLLRALDNGEIQPVGLPVRRVDVRAIAATDADLDLLVAEGRFRRALLYRLSGAVIHVPPLRRRPVDIPILLQRFLREHLSALGAAGRLDGADPEAGPWLRADLLRRLMAYPFPGNVRELRSVALAIAARCHDQLRAELPEGLLALLEEPREPETPRPRPAVLDEATVRQALSDQDWNLARSAAALGVSRNTLIEAMARIPGLRQARDLDAPTIRAALLAEGGSLERAARHLQVSVHGLRLRMNALSIAAKG